MASLMCGSSLATVTWGLRSQAIAGGRGVRCSASVAGENHYKTLKLRPGATQKEVKNAFRKLALKYHPDVCKGNQCTTRFQQINQAYEMILDELRKSEQQSEKQEKEESIEISEEFDRSPEEWMGCEGAFVFSGGSPESVYCY